MDAGKLSLVNKHETLHILDCMHHLGCRNCLGSMVEGVDSTALLEIPYGQFLAIFVSQSKLKYYCGSHAKGESQKFKIEEIEEL